MEKVETHFVETKDYIYRTKVDLVKNESDEIIRFKIVCYDRVVEFDKNKDPMFNVDKLDAEDRKSILRDGFKNVGKPWNTKQIKLLIEYFESNDGDIEKISVLMERTERSIRLKLIELELIEKD